jgi:CBS domain-containing protein
MTVAAVLKQKGASIISVGPNTSCVKIAEIITAQRIGALVVMDDDNTLVGIVSERDVVKAIATHREKALAMTAADLMTPKPVVATPETTVDEAMEIMDQGYFRHLPVMRDGKPAGIISIRDLVKYRIMQHQNDVESLTSYVYRAGT